MSKREKPASFAFEKNGVSPEKEEAEARSIARVQESIASGQCFEEPPPPPPVYPFGEGVLVRPLQESGKKKGLIYIPDTALGKPNKGEVVTWGEDVKIRLSRGQRVLYGRMCGVSIMIKEEEYLIMQAGDLLASIEYDEDE